METGEQMGAQILRYVAQNFSALTSVIKYLHKTEAGLRQITKIQKSWLQTVAEILFFVRGTEIENMIWENQI